MEEEGLKLLRKAKQATGLAIVTEVMSESDVELVAEYADILQIGARNMQNFSLLKALGRTTRPILLKRGMSSTIRELLMSAEYIVAHGNPNVVLCERGIRTFETATRNTCDIAGGGRAQRTDAPAGDRRSQPRRPAGAAWCRRWPGRRWRSAPTGCWSRSIPVRRRPTATAPSRFRIPRIRAHDAGP